MGRFLPAAWEFGPAFLELEAFQAREGAGALGALFVPPFDQRRGLCGQIPNPSSNQASRVTAWEKNSD
jgi:hypothetical protein